MVLESNETQKIYVALSDMFILGKKKKEKEDDSDVAISANYGVASSLNWSMSICNLKTGIMRTRGPSMTTASFQR